MDALRTLVLLVLALQTLSAVSSSQAPACSYFSLLSHLQLSPANDALKVMRPVKNWTRSTFVGLNMLVFGILHVDEKSQTIESSIWTEMMWTNEFTSWNSSMFCGIEVVYIPRSRLWVPDIYIQEDASDTGSVYHGPYLTLVYNGIVVANVRQRLTSTCELDLQVFPFDTQKCSITFASMNHFESEITLGTFSNDTALFKASDQLMITRGEWELDDIETISESAVRHDMNQSMLIYKIFISRKPMLYVVNFIIPLFYLLVLDLASFFISESRGEKLSFKVTILLSISVLLLILQDMLPSTESRMPFIASYCVAIFALVGISVLEAMLVSFLYDLDNYCANKPQCFAETQEEMELEEGGHRESPADDGAQEKQEKDRLPLDGPVGCDLLKQILEEVKKTRQEAIRHREVKKPERYRRASEIIDHVFFYCYFLTVIVLLAYMYSYWFIKMFK